MNLVDRYVYDVTRRLPEKQRQDVRRELRSEIEAMIEDEARAKKPTKKDVYDVLVRMGDPVKLADQYTERKTYIIGPLYYHTYIQLLKTLLLVVLPVIIFFTFTGRLATVNDHILVSLFHSFGAALEVAVHIFFWVTLSFVLVERYSQTKEMPVETWTPDQLPKLPAEQHISKTDAILGITWSVIAVWATAMQIPAIHQFFASEVPLFFAPAMWPYWTIALLVISLISLGTEIMKLIIGGWTKLMVFAITIANVLVVTFFASLIMLVKPVINPDFTALVSHLLKNQNVAAGTDLSVKIFVIIVVGISLYEIFQAVKSYKASKRRDN